MLSLLCGWKQNAIAQTGKKIQLKKLSGIKKNKSMAVISQNKRVIWNILVMMWENQFQIIENLVHLWEVF